MAGTGLPLVGGRSSLESVRRPAQLDIICCRCCRLLGLTTPQCQSGKNPTSWGNLCLVGNDEVCVLMAFLLLIHFLMLSEQFLDCPGACVIHRKVGCACAEMSPVDYCEACPASFAFTCTSVSCGPCFLRSSLPVVVANLEGKIGGYLPKP